MKIRFDKAMIIAALSVAVVSHAWAQPILQFAPGSISNAPVVLNSASSVVQTYTLQSIYTGPKTAYFSVSTSSSGGAGITVLNQATSGTPCAYNASNGQFVLPIMPAPYKVPATCTISLQFSPGAAADTTAPVNVTVTMSYSGLYSLVNNDINYQIQKNWHSTLGPEGGTVNAIAGLVSPSVVYLAVENQGMYSLSNGDTWTQASAFPSPAAPFPSGDSVVIDPNDSTGETLYIGTDNSGIYKSINGGTSWTSLSGVPTTEPIASLAAGTGAIYAATEGNSVYFSTNSGTSWTQASTIPTSADVVAVTTNATGATAYAAVGTSVYVTANTGSTWALATAPGGTVNGLAIDPSTSTIVYAATSTGVLKSINGGGAWTAMSIPGGIIPIEKIVTTGTDIYIGTASGVYKSTGGGAFVDFNNATLPVNKDITSLQVIDSTVYAGNSGGGIFTIGTTGSTWQSFNTGLVNSSIQQSLAVDSVTGYVYAGTAGGGIFMLSNGSSWSAPLNTGLTELSIRGIGITPSRLLYAGTSGSGMFESDINSINWSGVSSGLTTEEMRAVTVAGSFVYSGTSTPGGLFLLSGNTWLANNTNPFYVRSIGAGSQYVYSALDGLGIYRTTVGAVNSTPFVTGLPVNAYMRAVAVAPNGDVYGGGTPTSSATNNPFVYKSTDNGASWTTTNFPASTNANYIYAIAIAPNGSSYDVFAGTDTGVYKSSDQGATWVAYNQGLNFTEVRSLAIKTNTAGGYQVYMGSNGGGVYYR